RQQPHHVAYDQGRHAHPEGHRPHARARSAAALADPAKASRTLAPSWRTKRSPLDPHEYSAGDLVVEPALVGVPDERWNQQREQQRADDRTQHADPRAVEGHHAKAETQV